MLQKYCKTIDLPYAYICICIYIVKNITEKIWKQRYQKKQFIFLKMFQINWIYFCIKWIHTFLKGINTIRNLTQLIQDLNWSYFSISYADKRYAMSTSMS